MKKSISQDGYIEVDLGNGQLKRGNIKNGKEDGVWEMTDPNGNLWVRENYKEGVLHGLSETYYLNSNEKLHGRNI